MTSATAWPLRFTQGEQAAMIQSGQWTGKTIVDYAREAAALDPATPVLMADDVVLTISGMIEQATDLARGLHAMGLKRGDTVSFQLPNWIETGVIDLACAMGGFIVNPIVPIYRHAELAFILKDARARLVFVPDTFRGINYVEMIQSLRAQLPDLAHLVVVRGNGENTYEQVMRAGRAVDVALDPARPDEAKLVIYTSGTTGPAKGVLYSHNQARRTLANSYEAWDLKRGARVLIGSPVTHVSGFSYGLDWALYLGTQSVLMERWDGAQAVELIERHKVGVMLGATPFMAELVAQAERVGSRLPSLEIFMCGGAAVPPELVRKAQRTFVNCRTFRVFGSSECPMITQGCYDDAELGATTDGKIYGYDYKVVDDDQNRLPPDHDGELLVKGPAMFRGYTNAQATAEAFDDEGYFRTGDVVRVTADGILTVTGRKKDLIIRGGENLSAKEIEDALYGHPDIADIAVVSMPHPRLGEGVCAFVVPRGNARPDREGLAQHMKASGLAPQKWPERVVLVEQLPRTPSGKVQKHLLRKDVSDIIARETDASALEIARV